MPNTKVKPVPKPEKIIVYSFLGAILLGTLLLMAPFATKSGHMPVTDAIFTATSAVCVTGLSVVDIGSDLTFWGQVIILLLIQAGGLGIMTFSVLFFIMLGRRTSLTTRLSISNISLKIDTLNLKRTLKIVVLTTFIFETIGAMFLFTRFNDIHPIPFAVFSSIFHAVSAFCNAGFSLYSDSLSRFSGSFFVPSVMIALIVLGGLGFMVINELLLWGESVKKHEKIRISLHTKIALTGTAALLLIGTAIIWPLESQNLLASYSPAHKFMNSLFLSVTARTAGFNTVNTALLSDATLFFLLFLMFVGGCPGSTAGGIKINTFMVLCALVAGKLKGTSSTSVYNRKIPSTVIDKTLMIFAASLLLLFSFLFMMLIVEKGGLSHASSRGGFLEIFFETTSAFGTVGLSTGITPMLTVSGKLLLVLLMFAGRIGPITLGIALHTRRKKDVKYDYAEEEIMVG